MRSFFIALAVCCAAWIGAAYALEKFNVSPVATQIERRSDLINSL